MRFKRRNAIEPTGLEWKRPGNRAFRLVAGWLIGLGAIACRQEPVTIRAGLLLDGRGDQRRDVMLTIVGSRIRAVEDWRGQPVTWDLSRFTVLPGLIDAHVHISGFFNHEGRASIAQESQSELRAALAANASATLGAGFTTVASMGAWDDRWLRGAIERQEIPGPRILTSLSPLLKPEFSVEQLREAVRERKRLDADFIKVFDSRSPRQGGAPTLSSVQLAAVCSEAHANGLRAVVHVQSDSAIRDAIAAGCDEVEHGFLATRASLSLLVDKGVWFDPQCRLILANYLEHWARFDGLPGMDSNTFKDVNALVPVLPRVIRTFLAIPGARMLYGTDAVAGAHGRNAEDLICRVREAGQAPMEALMSATSVNATALGLGDRIGTIAPGYQADLIALDGNPLDSIEAVRRVVFVMRAAKVFKH